MESEIVPYHLSEPEGKRVLVLAPHPDDEAIGCGGTITLLLRLGRPVKVVFLTSGDKADPTHPSAQIFDETEQSTEYALMREKEARKSLRMLGISDYEFLRFPDRELQSHYDDVRSRLLRIIGEFGPDTIYSPSPVEYNPDHRTTAALSLDIQISLCGVRDGGTGIAFYEVTTPLRPNVLIDVSRVYSKKKRAIRKYRSQLRLLDYLSHTEAMNTIRTLTVSDARRVEAFWLLKRHLTEEEKRAWLNYA